MLTIDENDISTIVCKWETRLLAIKRKDKDNLSDREAGIAEGYQDIIKDFETLLKTRRQQARTQIENEINSQYSRNNQSIGYIALLTALVTVLIPFLYVIGAFRISGIIMPFFLIIALARLIVTRWKVKKNIFLPITFSLIGVFLLAISKSSENLISGLSASTANLGGEIMGAALVGILIILLTRKVKTEIAVILAIFFFIGFNLVYTLDTNLPNLAFWEIVKTVSGILGVEIAGAGITVILIDDWADI